MPLCQSEIADGGMANVWFVDRELVRRGSSVTAVTRATSAGANTTTRYGVTVTEIPFVSSPASGVLQRDYDEGVSFVTGIPADLLTRKWTAIHVHHWTSAVGLDKRLRPAQRVVYTPHLLAVEKAVAVLGGLLPTHVRSAEQAILRRADLIICLSEDERDRILDEYAIDPQLCKVIPNGVAMQRDRRVARSSSATRVRVVSVGRICRQKGLDTLVRALVEVGKRVDLQVDVIGGSYDEPDFERELSENIQSTSIQINFLGPRSHQAVLGILNTADIYVQPSRYESQGIAIQEAMTAGLPVIVTDLPAVRAYCTHGVNAVIVPPDDHHALAEALITLARDADLRHRLGSTASATSLRWTWDDCTAATVEAMLDNSHRTKSSIPSN